MRHKFNAAFNSLRHFMKVFQQDLTEEELEFLVVHSIDAILDNAAVDGEDETWWKIINELHRHACGVAEAIIYREVV
jgi:hypothetical protein